MHSFYLLIGKNHGFIFYYDTSVIHCIYSNNSFVLALYRVLYYAVCSKCNFQLKNFNNDIKSINEVFFEFWTF